VKVLVFINPKCGSLVTDNKNDGIESEDYSFITKTGKLATQC